MSTEHAAGGFGATAQGGEMWSVFEQLRSSFERRTGVRMRRGDVREAVLALLAEQPMHGYQIIREIEKRSGGSWRPSAGSVYPTLQLLADEGIITAEHSNGKKTYVLTEDGREQAEAASATFTWDGAKQGDALGRGALPKAGLDLAHAATQVGRSGSAEQVKQAVEVLEDARRRLYAILAEH